MLNHYLVTEVLEIPFEMPEIPFEMQQKFKKSLDKIFILYIITIQTSV